MKAFIALFVATLAVAAQGSYVESAWPASTYGLNSWNTWNGLNSWNGLNTWNGLNSYNGLNSWNDHGISTYPYRVNQVSSWPATSAYNGYNGYNGWYDAGKTVVQANVAKVNPWGLPVASYGYGYNNYLGAVPAAKYVATNPGSIHVAPQVGHVVNQKLIVAGHGY